MRIESLESRAVFNADAVMDVVFAPDTPAEVMAAYEDLPGQDGFDNFTFNDSDRWSRTATNTTTLAQGDATVIRWSIVPDGTPINGYNGEAAAPSNLRSWLAGIYGTNASSTAAADQPWFSVMQSVFDRWSSVSGVTYVYEAADDGASLSSQNAGSIGRRGDVRISGHYIDGPSNILAYNFYPTVGDMVLDTGDTFFNSTTNNSLRLRNTMAHELGHGLGLGHVTPVTGTKLMEPSISLGYDGPQADDILAVNRGYGDRLEKNGANNTAATASSLGSGATFTLDTLSIDDDSDVDWFQFTVGTNSSISVNLTPTGSTYTSGSTSFNSLTQSNLALAIYGSNGATLLASANAGAAGVAESLTNFNLPASGTYYVRVTGSANAAQMYRLSGTLSNVVTTNSPEIAVLDGATDIVDGTGTVNLGSGNVGSTVSRTFTVQNTGSAALTLGSVSIPTGFVLTQAPLTTVAAGSSTTFVIALDTAVAGTFGGAVSFTNNDANENPFNFSVSGIVNATTPATAPEITVLDGTTVLVDGQSTLTFPSVAVGGVSTKTLTIRNDGTANLTLSQLILPQQYSIVSGPALTTLVPGASTTITLGLNTSTAGTFSGAMVLANNDANEGPFNFNVTGTVTSSTPATQFSDNFNRANSSALGSNWTERSGNMSINSQALINSVSGTSVALVTNRTMSDVVLTADVNLGFSFSSRDSGLVARHSGTGAGSQYWGGLAYRNGRYYAEIWESASGSWTRLSQTQVSTGSGALKFEVIGTSLKLYVNNVLRGSATDSTLTSGGVGVSATNTGSKLDNFVASPAAAPITAPITAPPAVTTANSAVSPSAQWLAALEQLLTQWSQHRNR